MGQPDEATLFAATLLLGELLGHLLEIDWRRSHIEAIRIREKLAYQQRQQEKELAKVLTMLFPEGSAIAAGVIAELVPPDLLAAGLNFEEFAFDRCIGEGAFSRVYGATYRGEPVAVKQLSRDRAALDVVRGFDVPHLTAASDCEFSPHHHATSLGRFVAARDHV